MTLKEQLNGIPLGLEIGVDVYFIPSYTNYKLNLIVNMENQNKVYHQKVDRITFTDKGWFIECDKEREWGTGRTLTVGSFKTTWFLTQKEAEEHLREYKNQLREEVPSNEDT